MCCVTHKRTCATQGNDGHGKIVNDDGYDSDEDDDATEEGQQGQQQSDSVPGAEMQSTQQIPYMEKDIWFLARLHTEHV
jgi:hypothetical protein